MLAGLAAGFLPRAEPPRPAVVGGCALAALAGLTALSMAWASDQGAAFEDAIRVLAYGGVFLLVVVVTRSGDAPAWLRGVAIGATAVAGLAVLARLEPSLFGYPERELAAQVPADANRLSWPIGYWNGLGALCAISVGLLAWLGAGAANRAARTLSIGAMPVTILCLYATTSRGGVIAAAIALIVLIVAGPRRLRLAASSAVGLAAGVGLVWAASPKSALFDHPGTDLAATQGDEVLAMLAVAVVVAAAVRYLLDGRIERISEPRLERRTWIRIGIGAAIVVVVAIVLADPAQRWEEFKSPPTVADTAGERHIFSRGGSSGRWQFWSAAYGAFETEPFRGIGAGGYPAWWNQHGTLPSDTRNAHSLAMDTLAELGVVGIVVVIAFFAAVAVCGIRRVRSVGDSAPPPRPRWRSSPPDVWGSPPTGTGTCRLSLRRRSSPPHCSRGRRRSPPTCHGSRCGVSLAAGAGLPPGSRSSASRGSRSARRACCSPPAMSSPRASTHPTTATSPRPPSRRTTRSISSRWAADPRRRLAEVMLEAGNLPEAAKAIDEALVRARQDPELWLVRAQVQLASGDRQAAVASVAFAKNLAPRAPELQPSIADLLKAIS